MTDPHDIYREWAGAYVLGSLEPSERAEYERHLRRCAECQADVTGFAALPGLLAQHDPTNDSGERQATDRITRLAIAGADNDYSRLRTSVHRWRLTALGAAAAIILVAAAIGVAILPGTDDGGTELAFDGRAAGTVTIDERAWGTSIDLDLRGLPTRPNYQLWAIDVAGVWTPAATWTSTPNGLARLTGAAAVAFGDIDRVVITSAERSDVLVDATTRSS